MSDLETTHAAEEAILDCLQANVTLQTIRVAFSWRDLHRHKRVIDECVARNRCLAEFPQDHGNPGDHGDPGPTESADPGNYSLIQTNGNYF